MLHGQLFGKKDYRLSSMGIRPLSFEICLSLPYNSPFTSRSGIGQRDGRVARKLVSV